MSVEERDTHSGYLTTGHEWNGIKELNTPVPRLVWLALVLTTLFAVVYCVLMPAFPLGSTYTRGVLGADDRAAVMAAVRQAQADRSRWTDLIADKSYADVRADPGLIAQVRATGAVLFGDNCAACHGRDARGGHGFPDLTTQSWLWGGTPEAIAETIRVGVNAEHPDTRVSQMPAFGRDSMLKREEMDNVVAYVRSLSVPATAESGAGRIAAGKTVFADHCAACHGPEGKGNPEVGSPDLTDNQWIHGASANALYADVWGGLQGRMPSWEGRLSPLERKILVLYVLDQRRP